MKLYFIDFENVSQAGFAAVLKQVTPEDRIYCFYTNANYKLSLDVIASICCEVTYIKVKAGKDSLDKNLLTYMGFSMHNFGPKVPCIIVSNDLGYDCVLDYWKSQNYNIERLHVSNDNNPPAETPFEPTLTKQFPLIAGTSQHTKCNQKLASAVNSLNVSSQEKSIIAKYIAGKERSKNEIYQWLIKQYTQKKASEIYNKLKPFLN